MSLQYKSQQIIFCLNSIANAPSGRQGTVPELECYAKEVITKVFDDPGAKALIGRWRLVWGPAVFQANDSNVADNAMYVAQSKSDPDHFVVAISGTNPISAYGWIDEDIMINPLVPWPYGGTDAGEITNGTSVGLNILLNELTSNGQVLSKYLADQVANCNSALTIHVTGHSLGGALSPSTALALFDTQGIPLDQPNGWDPDATSHIKVLPSAGPTPGNETWRNYYDQPDKLGHKTDRLWNAIDVVPHAWQISMLNEIPTIYKPDIPENPIVDFMVELAVANSTCAGNLQQILPKVPGLLGKVDTSITISVKNIIVMLETLLANDLIDKLAGDLSPDVLALLKGAIDEFIEILNQRGDQTAMLSVDDLFSFGSPNLKAMQTDDESLWGLLDMLKNFLSFLFQLAYQHTTAYQELIGTTEFHAIVGAIEVEVGKD